mgnify:CR=1 FL=1
MFEFEFNKLCGQTPLIKVSEKLYAKLETYNPTGSVKDRMIAYVVGKALRNGLINPNTICCEATSGNSGISLSAIAASMKLKCVIFMPCNMSEERKQMMRLYGAEIVEAPPNDFAAAIAMRDEFLSVTKNSWSPLQFSNVDNIACHREETAPEIESQVKLLGKTWSAFIHGSGTGGTIEGIRQYARDVSVHMVIPEEEKHGIQGIGDGQNFLADPQKVNGTIIVSTPDAIQRAKLFAKQTGLLVGISSGANLIASERWLDENECAGVVVTMLCDRGERYMSLY